MRRDVGSCRLSEAEVVYTHDGSGITGSGGAARQNILAEGEAWQTR